MTTIRTAPPPRAESPPRNERHGEMRGDMPRGKTTYQLNVRLDFREEEALKELNEHYKDRYEQSAIIRMLILREARRIKKQKAQDQENLNP